MRMKLLRYGAAGREKPGILDADGAIRDLSGVVADLAGTRLDATASIGSVPSILRRCPWSKARPASGRPSAWCRNFSASA